MAVEIDGIVVGWFFCFAFFALFVYGGIVKDKARCGAIGFLGVMFCGLCTGIAMDAQKREAKKQAFYEEMGEWGVLYDKINVSQLTREAKSVIIEDFLKRNEMPDLSLENYNRLAIKGAGKCELLKRFVVLGEEEENEQPDSDT